MSWKLYAVVMVLIALGAAGTFAVRPVDHRPSTVETLRVADAHQITSALLYIAVTEHYFADDGLAVVVKPYASGKAAFAALLDGKADVATVAEAPFIRAVLESKPVQVFASIVTSDKDFAVTARTDAGITTPKDLHGKRIGTIPGTGGEAFLDLFLAMHDLNRSGVVVVPFTPDEAVAALAQGSIDAVSAWTTVRLQAQAKLPDGTVSFFGDGLYTKIWTLASRQEFLHRRPEVIQKLLRALLKAERFTIEHQPQAIDIVARQLGLDPETVAALWDNFGFTVGLDQALVVNLEHLTRAVTHLQPPVELPNFLHRVYLDGLAAVAPTRVTVPHSGG